jgi:predicted transcriptional regulator of viral defense system
MTQTEQVLDFIRARNPFSVDVVGLRAQFPTINPNTLRGILVRLHNRKLIERSSHGRYYSRPEGMPINCECDSCVYGRAQ